VTDLVVSYTQSWSALIFSSPSYNALTRSSFLFFSAPREEKMEPVCRYRQDLRQELVLASSLICLICVICGWVVSESRTVDSSTDL